MLIKIVANTHELDAQNERQLMDSNNPLSFDKGNNNRGIHDEGNIWRVRYFPNLLDFHPRMTPKLCSTKWLWNKFKISIKNHQNSLQFDAHSSQCDQHASSSRLACFLASALSHCSNVEPIQRFCWASRKCKAHYDDSCSCFPEHMEPMIWCQHRRPVLVVALVHNRSYKCFDRGQKSSQVSYKL